MKDHNVKKESSSEPFIPKKVRSLSALAESGEKCRGCELYLDAEHVVFGEGDPDAKIMIIGEQPGDEEDKVGRPFVGPSGKLLRKMLDSAGVESFYISNAVKHFRWSEKRGKRRIHRKPGVAHINACRPWQQAERELIRPKLIICLGTTAARSVLGKVVKIKDLGYKFLTYPSLGEVLVLQHPSAILRMTELDERNKAEDQFESWLKKAWKKVSQDS